MNGRRIGWIAAALMVLLIAYAWIDGGQEAIHPISETIPVPDRAQ